MKKLLELRVLCIIEHLKRYKTFRIIAFHFWRQFIHSLYKSKLLQLINYYEERNLEIKKLPQVDHNFCTYTHHEFEQSVRDVRSHVNNLMSALLSYLPEVKGSLHISHRLTTAGGV